MTTQTKSDLRRALTATLPVLTGYVVLGMGFGVILNSRGYGILWALAMSIFIYAGSMQYVAIDLLTGGASLLTTALTTLAVNARHLFYGISMVDKYRTMKLKPFLIFTLTDETYSLVCSDAGMDGIHSRNRYFVFVSLFNYLYWITGSVIGNLLGSVLPFSTEGIDFALTALFLTVFVEQWLSTKNHTSALVGIIASVLCLVLIGPENFLIPAMLLITLALTLLQKQPGITNEPAGDSTADGPEGGAEHD
ncbi:MAG: AzlC family ABC transporter permease [Clostridia bacterium]|nr:AzlC family ABC transporter permease [Clostridia bacterium]